MVTRHRTAKMITKHTILLLRMIHCASVSGGTYNFLIQFRGPRCMSNAEDRSELASSRASQKVFPKHFRARASCMATRSKQRGITHAAHVPAMLATKFCFVYNIRGIAGNQSVASDFEYQRTLWLVPTDIDAHPSALPYALSMNSHTPDRVVYPTLCKRFATQSLMSSSELEWSQ